MSIASMVTGGLAASQANPNFNMWQVASPPDQSQFWGNFAQAPKTAQLPGWNDWNFSKYSAPDPQFQKYQQQAPQYKGLMDGDYNALQDNLATPGRIDAKSAYDDTRRRLSAGATNRGQYGSSMYTNQMVNSAEKPYLDTLAKINAQAGATRYGMQQNDLQFGQGQLMQEWLNRLAENTTGNQFGYNVWNSRLNENNLMNQLMASQNIAKNNYNLGAAGQQLAIDNAPINFNNAVSQARYGDLWDRTNYSNSQAQRLMGNVMNWAQGTDELSDSLRSQQISKMASSGEQGMGGLLGGVGSLAGTALSFIPGVGPFLGAGMSSVGAATKSLPSGFGSNYINTPGTTMTGGSFRAMS